MAISASFPHRPPSFIALLLVATIVHIIGVKSVNAVCELSYRDHNKLYNYSLASPLRKFPHGVLSEDGFYKVAVNETVVWFQLCDSMLFNHDPPACIDCGDCGGSSRCGMGCSALASNMIGGYPVCNSIGHLASTTVYPMDTKQPHMGVIVKMSNIQPRLNCSLSVTVVCDYNNLQGPHTLEKSGTCDYATQLRHPAGCAKVISTQGSGWGWFGTLLFILLCFFAAYMLAGIIYRHFFLNIHGIDMIPNLEFWASLPHKVQVVSKC
ncbi:OLC1v1026893C1 [Oldenlandia corymbosa var. corymbosa]|uniref:OLC1v1026893C1 n=1 Tax=Oldenlandia corymbosa var. corymbosa TaxID=529605 RepID=A0AAV1C850_OLDCO|nr:OLC1v1026893C1 [Oldenlandia corymbosa var. corymbosa]